MTHSQGGRFLKKSPVVCSVPTNHMTKDLVGVAPVQGSLNSSPDVCRLQSL